MAAIPIGGRYLFSGGLPRAQDGRGGGDASPDKTRRQQVGIRDAGEVPDQPLRPSGSRLPASSSGDLHHVERLGIDAEFAMQLKVGSRQHASSASGGQSGAASRATQDTSPPQPSPSRFACAACYAWKRASTASTVTALRLLLHLVATNFQRLDGDAKAAANLHTRIAPKAINSEVYLRLVPIASAASPILSRKLQLHLFHLCPHRVFLGSHRTIWRKVLRIALTVGMVPGGRTVSGISPALQHCAGRFRRGRQQPPELLLGAGEQLVREQARHARSGSVTPRGSKSCRTSSNCSYEPPRYRRPESMTDAAHRRRCRAAHAPGAPPRGHPARRYAACRRTRSSWMEARARCLIRVNPST